MSQQLYRALVRKLMIEPDFQNNEKLNRSQINIHHKTLKAKTDTCLDILIFYN